MRKFLIPLLVLYVIALSVAFSTLWTKHKIKSDAAKQKAAIEAQCDSAVITAIRSRSTLFTAEVSSSKTMTYSSSSKLSFNFMGIDKDVSLPFSKTEATIPVTMTYKAGINLQEMTGDNIQISQYPGSEGHGGVIVITLPDPVIVETAVRVDHENERLKKEFLGKGLTYEKYQELVRQAKREAWEGMSEEDLHDIVETAKVSATEIIIPRLRAIGFTDITVQYRQDIDFSSLEKRKD